MRKLVCFGTSPTVEQALAVAVAGLQAKHPGQKVTRSDAMRTAIVALAARVQRVAKSPTRMGSAPAPVSQPEAV